MQTQDMIRSVQAAVSEVFSTMLGVQVEPHMPRRDVKGPHMSEGVISFVSLAGEWVGNGLICCRSNFACRLCSLLLMTDSEHVDEEVLDAVGEIANMVVGNFKTLAEAVVGPLTLSIPTTIHGKSFTSKSLGSSEWTIMPFKCGEDEFHVWLWFAPAAAHVQRHTSFHLQVG